MSSAQGWASDGTTLVEVVGCYEADGYTGQFTAVDGGLLRCLSCHRDLPPADAVIDALRRTEGASDPGDMAAVIALCCPRCGSKGTAVLKYGPDAEPEESEVLLALDDVRLDQSTESGGVGAAVAAANAPEAPPAD